MRRVLEEQNGMSGRAFVALLALLSGACGESAQRPVALDLEVRGVPLSAPVEVSESFSIALDRAELAFGPLYVCPGRQAGDLCDTARLEWRDSVVVDALTEDAVWAGRLEGATGPVLSWMFDYGFTSLLTESEPLVLPAAAALGGASLVLAGEATLEGARLPFSARVVVRQEGGAGRGVPVVRKSTSAPFSHEVTEADEALVVTFDPGAWAKRLVARDFVERASCAAGKPIVCDGSVELTCDEAGALEAQRDCADEGLVCAPGQGCADAVNLGVGSESYRALVQALTAGAPPRFEFR